MPGQKDQAGSQDDFRLYSRVTSYSPISSLMASAKSYYDSAKERIPLVKPTLNTVEDQIGRGAQWLKTMPTVVPIIKAADDMGMKGLDKLESCYVSPRDKLASTVERSKVQLQNLRQAAGTTMSTPFEEKLAPAADDYLKRHSLLMLPITAPLRLVVSVSESVFDRFFASVTNSNTDSDSRLTTVETMGMPGSASGKQKVVVVAVSGPVMRATVLSRRIQQEAIAKWNTLAETNVVQGGKQIMLQTEEQIGAMMPTFPVEIARKSGQTIRNLASRLYAAWPLDAESQHRKAPAEPSTAQHVEEMMTNTH